MEGEGGEGEEPRRGEGVAREPGGSHVGVEGAELGHGGAPLEAGEDGVDEVVEAEVGGGVRVSLGGGEAMGEEDEGRGGRNKVRHYILLVGIAQP